MSNYSKSVSTGDWELVYDASASGDFNGYVQVTNGTDAFVYVGNSAPSITAIGGIADIHPRQITALASSSDKIYAKRGSGVGIVSLMSINTVQIVAGQSAVGSVPANPPVGVSGVDGEGKKRALLTDAIGQMMTSEQDSAVFTASATSASVLLTVDMSNWRSVLLQVTSAGSSCTIAYECSNDQTGWTPVMGNFTNYSSASTLGAVVASSTTAAAQMQFPKRAKYFRARVSVYGSGTVSVAYALSLEDTPSAQATILWGQVAEGSSLGGNPVTIGIEARTATKTAVSSGQVVRPIGTTDGRLVVCPHSIPENEWAYAAASGGIVNTTTAVTIKAAAGANVRNYITSFQIQAEALTNATEVAIRDGAGGTVLWRIKVPTTGLPLLNVTFADPLKSTANTLLEVVTLTASGTGAVYVNAQGYIAP